MKAQVIDVNPTLTKLTKRKENVDQLLSNQICMFKKSDLRYKPIKNERLSSNFFVIASSFLSIYNSYSKNDFHEKYCKHKNISTKIKFILVPKGTFTNLIELIKL